MENIYFDAVKEAQEKEEKPLKRTYPAYIEDKTFLPTLSTKTLVLDENEEYNELPKAISLHKRERASVDSDNMPEDCERWHVCHKCNKVFGTAKELKRHLPRHKVSKKVYECEICLRTFTQSNHLKQHMPVHSGKELLKKKATTLSFNIYMYSASSPL